jgi:hypothetical protein
MQSKNAGKQQKINSTIKYRLINIENTFYGNGEREKDREKKQMDRKKEKLIVTAFNFFHVFVCRLVLLGSRILYKFMDWSV